MQKTVQLHLEYSAELSFIFLMVCLSWFLFLFSFYFLSIFFLSSISLLVLCRFYSCLSVSLFSHKVIADHLHDDSNDPLTRIGNKEDVETSVGWEYSKDPQNSCAYSSYDGQDHGDGG